MMVEYGLTVINDSGSTVINSKRKVLVFSERGSFLITSQFTNRPGLGVYNFLKPVKTLAPPQIFLRTVSANNSSITLYIVTTTGSPGNWTGVGFMSAAGGVDLQRHNMEIVVCKYSDELPKSGYGMIIRDDKGQMLFSSDDRVVRYSRFSKVWTKIAGATVDAYQADVTPSEEEFICLTQMDRGVNWFTRQANYATLQIRRNNAPVMRLQVDYQPFGNYYQGTNGTCFSIPVCKFPIDRYYND